MYLMVNFFKHSVHMYIISINLKVVSKKLLLLLFCVTCVTCGQMCYLCVCCDVCYLGPGVLSLCVLWHVLPGARCVISVSTVKTTSPSCCERAQDWYHALTWCHTVSTLLLSGVVTYCPIIRAWQGNFLYPSELAHIYVSCRYQISQGVISEPLKRNATK